MNNLLLQGVSRQTYKINLVRNRWLRILFSSFWDPMKNNWKWNSWKLLIVAKFLRSQNPKSILKPNFYLLEQIYFLQFACRVQTHCTMLIMSGLNWGGVFVLLFDLLLKISLGRKTIKYVLHYWLVLPPPACATLQGRRNVKTLSLKKLYGGYNLLPPVN